MSRPGSYRWGPKTTWSSRDKRTALSRQRQINRRSSAWASSRASSFAPTSVSRNIMLPETKYFDVGFDNTNAAVTTSWAGSEVPCDDYIDSNGTAAAYTDSALIPSANGSGYGQVVGNRYKLKKVRVRGTVSPESLSNLSVPAGAAIGRVMLVMDTQPNGAQAQGEDIMQDMGLSGANIMSFKRTSFSSGRFRILKDEFLHMPIIADQPNSTTTQDFGYDSAKFTFQYTPKVPIQVNVKSGNATPTVAGLETCNIFLLTMVNIANSAGIQSGATYRVSGSSRAYYCE